MSKRIYITKSYLPPIDEYFVYMQGIWERNKLTNNGPLVKLLEQELRAYLSIKNLSLLSNGTTALQIAIKALDLHGEIITTPFSYVATTSSIVWEGCKPVFADIDPETLCIDPAEIEQAITSKTSAILATHVYGIPCDVERIERIAKKHGLKVLYDAAHTFGVKFNGKSLLSYGDISILSFHATKLFHTIEGGAVITEDDQLAKKINYMRNFGHKGQEDFYGLGINGKISEFHAAMGLTILPHIEELLDARRRICEEYDKLLLKVDLMRPKVPENTSYNYAYYPVLFPNETSLLAAKSALNKKDVFPRRYFYPSLNNLPYIHGKKMMRSEEISKRVLCLPLFPELSLSNVTKIIEIIEENL